MVKVVMVIEKSLKGSRMALLEYDLWLYWQHVPYAL